MGVYDSMLGFGPVRQAMCISLSVFLCDFLFALPLLWENGGHIRSISCVWLDVREESALATMWEVGSVAVTKMRSGRNQMPVG